MLVAMAATLANSARAGYLVTTFATSSVEFVNSAITYGYNYSALGTGFHTSGGGQYTTGSGTTDTAGNAFSSFDQTSVNATIPPNPPDPQTSGSASAYATANLYTGSVGVAGSGMYLDYHGPSSGQAGGTGQFFAQIADTLHFTGGPGIHDIPVTFTMDAVGSGWNVTTPAGDSGGLVTATLGLGGASFTEQILDNNTTSYIPAVQNQSESGWQSFTFSSNTAGLLVFNGVYRFTGSQATVGIAETLSGRCGLGTACDYSQTASVAFNLPSGTTFTSDSGVFLSQSGSGQAPEPASAGLLAAGIAGLMLVQRYRKCPR